MGQYHYVVNLSKREYLNPHRLGTGLKLWEQLANHPGTGAALILLLCHKSNRGGGDLDIDENWHGPERDTEMRKGKIDGCTSATMPTTYKSIAARTIGRWHGDRIALIGDYADDSDLQINCDECAEFQPHLLRASQIYSLCDTRDSIESQITYLEKLATETTNPTSTANYQSQARSLRNMLQIDGPFTDISDDVCCVLEHELHGTFSGDGWRTWKPNKS